MKIVKDLLHFKRIPYLLAFISLVFWPSCTRPSLTVPITQEEREWLVGLFRDLLLENNGAYTLYGTKPLSLSLLEDPPTEEEKAKARAYFESLPPEKRPKIIRMKKRYDFKANYRKWQEIKNRFPIHRYLFGKFRLTEYAETIVFLNIEATVKTLLKYYSDFRRVLGEDFDPIQVVFEVEKEDSPFWNRVLKRDHALLGILLGYGQENAWFFEWWLKYDEMKSPIGDFMRSLPSTIYEDRDILYPDPKNFILPRFQSFGVHLTDKRLFRKYKKECAQIKSLYKGRDEVDVALEWLTK